MKSKEEVKFMVRRICEEFQVPLPDINYTWKGERGNANALRIADIVKTELNLPIAAWVGIEQLIVHECSHLVEFARSFYIPRKISHDLFFTEILIEVADFVKAEFNFEYNFGLEYPTVAKHAGSAFIPYGYQRKRITAINNAMLLGLTKEQAEELVTQVEKVK